MPNHHDKLDYVFNVKVGLKSTKEVYNMNHIFFMFTLLHNQNYKLI